MGLRVREDTVVFVCPRANSCVNVGADDTAVFIGMIMLYACLHRHSMRERSFHGPRTYFQRRCNSSDAFVVCHMPGVYCVCLYDVVSSIFDIVGTVLSMMYPEIMLRSQVHVLSADVSLNLPWHVASSASAQHAAVKSLLLITSGNICTVLRTTMHTTTLIPTQAVPQADE